MQSFRPPLSLILGLIFVSFVPLSNGGATLAEDTTSAQRTKAPVPKVAPSEEKFQTLLRKLLQRQGYTVGALTADGRLNICEGRNKKVLNLDNLRRRFRSDTSEAAFRDTLQSLLVNDAIPAAWKDAKDCLFLELQGEDYVAESCIQRSPCKGLRLFVACSLDKGHKLSLVTNEQLKAWGVTGETVFAQAATNMDKLLAQAKLEPLDDKLNRTIRFLDINSNLKASLVTSPGFKNKIKAQLGWPVYVVIPCADFIYITADKNQVNRLGAVVLKEYANSPSPLSQEIFLISDQGIKAYGSYHRKTTERKRSRSST
jgi:hypothetical protein